MFCFYYSINQFVKYLYLFGEFLLLLRYAYRVKVVPNGAVRVQVLLHCCYYCSRYYSIVVVHSVDYFLLSLRSEKWKLKIENCYSFSILIEEDIKKRLAYMNLLISITLLISKVIVLRMMSVLSPMLLTRRWTIESLTITTFYTMIRMPIYLMTSIMLATSMKLTLI